MTEVILGALAGIILLQCVLVWRSFSPGSQKQAQAQFEAERQSLTQALNEIQMALLKQSSEQHHALDHRQTQFAVAQQRTVSELKQQLTEQIAQFQQAFQATQLKAVDQLVTHLQQATQGNREELSQALRRMNEDLQKEIKGLTQSTDDRLKQISGEVEKRLSDGFEKTTQTFNDILKRLALIDDAQKKITELSTNVVSLQQVLADKRSRGAFGEVQLNSLIANVLPTANYQLQYGLSNGKIVDCMLFLPKPTGNVPVDAKFPLESYQKMTDFGIAEADRAAALRQFKQDIRKHISDIAGKYILPSETSDGAIMFIPAEAIFAEIHAHHSDIVEEAHRRRVWMASPSTLMAILTTARAVIKDEATRQQVHIIQEHLLRLGEDFGRFRGRFDNLARHIDQAAKDVQQIHTSADKISSRFEKIEKVDLMEEQGVNQALPLSSER